MGLCKTRTQSDPQAIAISTLPAARCHGSSKQHMRPAGGGLWKGFMEQAEFGQNSSHQYEQKGTGPAKIFTVVLMACVQNVRLHSEDPMSEAEKAQGCYQSGTPLGKFQISKPYLLYLLGSSHCCIHVG